MYLENLRLLFFKNYEELAIPFSPRINAFLGDNGSGKTNLLDAIHMLSMTRSAFINQDTHLVQWGQSYYMVEGRFQYGEQKETVRASFQRGQKKQLTSTLKNYDRLGDHLGRFPVVLIAPDDQQLISEGSEARRKFMDSIISQIDADYLKNLYAYQKTLKQRNSLLKMFAESGRVDRDALAAYDEPLLASGRKIYERRKSFLEEYLAHFYAHYQQLSHERESVHIHYQSDYEKEAFASYYQQQLGKDLALQRTTCGIHKDDFVLAIKGQPLKKFGSQGQQKTFVLALKLAQFDVFKEAKGTSPILLLDDVFDKLDEGRIHQLLAFIQQDLSGQVFVTDARPERTIGFLQEIGAVCKYFRVEDGTVSAMDAG